MQYTMDCMVVFGFLIWFLYIKHFFLNESRSGPTSYCMKNLFFPLKKVDFILFFCVCIPPPFQKVNAVNYIE